MSTIEDEDTFIRTAASVPKVRPRRLRAIMTVLTAQYAVVAIVACVSVAGVLRYLVTPQIVATFELIAAALKR
jgi:hypothetical protein